MLGVGGVMLARNVSVFSRLEMDSFLSLTFLPSETDGQGGAQQKGGNLEQEVILIVVGM